MPASEAATAEAAAAVVPPCDDSLNWNWAVAETLVETAEKMQTAAEQEQKINDRIKEAEHELREIDRLRKGMGSGHP